jgi:hypothetical protein
LGPTNPDLVIRHDDEAARPRLDRLRGEHDRLAVTGFRIRGTVFEVAIIASGSGVRTLARLCKAYGTGRWRKLKGKALIELAADGSVVLATLQWYEAHGIGRRERRRPCS